MIPFANLAANHPTNREFIFESRFAYDERQSDDLAGQHTWGPVRSNAGVTIVAYPINGRTQYRMTGTYQHETITDTFEHALDAAFTSYAWPGGYPVAYYDGDGGVLCASCAKREWLGEYSTSNPLTPDCSSEHLQGIMCDNCQKWIVEPSCANCGNEGTNDNPMYIGENTDYCMCADCLTTAGAIYIPDSMKRFVLSTGDYAGTYR